MLRSGAPWAPDLPGRYGFLPDLLQPVPLVDGVGVWDTIMDAITEAYGGDVRMIDSTSAVHHSAAALKKSHPDRCLGRSRGGLTTKIHAVTDERSLPVRLADHPGQRHDATVAGDCWTTKAGGQMLLADKAYDADWIRRWSSDAARSQHSAAQQPQGTRSASAPTFTRLATRLNASLTKLKYFRRIATRYDKLSSTFARHESSSLRSG